MNGGKSDFRLAPQLSIHFPGYNGPPFSLRLWDGRRWTFAPGAPKCTLAIQSPQALALLASGADEATLGAAFVRKEIDVEGDLFAAFGIAEHLMARSRTLGRRTFETALASTLSLQRFFAHGRAHSQRRDRASISFHYDLPVDFYRPWLGPSLAYSCAYFRHPDDCLDQAQEQKLELICQKLRLQPRERFLDIGCGWGSLVMQAALRHSVQAHGITLSREQASVANRRIRDAGLSHACIVEHRDYRACHDLRGSFGKIASVGMYEHVGLPNLATYFAAVHALLKPGGTFLNHGIVRAVSSPSPRHSFIDRFVFPDGRLVTLTQTIHAAEAAGFEVRDVENLREHYQLTLTHWVRGLQRHRDALLQLVPESTYRIWLLYTAGSAAAFESGRIAVHQVLLSRLDRGRSRLPLRREDWYANSAVTTHSADSYRLSQEAAESQVR